MKLERRDFIRSLLISLGSMGLLGSRGRVYALAHSSENTGELAPGCQFFNVAQARTLEAICDQIIPPDDYPGAKDVGVLYYIDNALSNWLPQNRWDYVAGLEAVDESSKQMFGQRFADLEWDEQTKVLQAMERGEAPGMIWTKLRIGAGGAKSSQGFLNTVISHTMQGYYGDPKYGGNRGKKSWEMIGFKLPDWAR